MKILNRSWSQIVLACIALVAGCSNITALAQSADAARPRGSVTLTPTPKAVLKASISSKPLQTLEELRASIRTRISSSDVQRGRVGVKIISLASGKVIFENDAEKFFIPASNMKNFTIAAALEKLGPDFRFVTSVYSAEWPDASGTVRGDLRIFGRGDISISTAFNNGDYYQGIDNLVEKITAAGVKRVEGDLVGDESYFKGTPVPYTWEWDDLQWYDGAEISALPINNNAVDLIVRPGVKDGQCLVAVQPVNPLVHVINTCVTSPSGTPSALKVFKPLNANILEVSGSMPGGAKEFTGYLTFTHPADLFVALLKRRLELKGVTLTGGALTMPTNMKAKPPEVEIAQLESPPFSVIAAQTMKPSQNMFTETILWTLGEKFGRQPSSMADSSTLGLDVVKDWLKQTGISNNAVIQYDGSGMSRHDQVTPSAVAALYAHMAKRSKYKQVWLDSLTVGGVDGTLKRRFSGTTAEGNIRGKTGTLDQVSALSGYLTTAGGEQIVISVLVNGVAEPRTRTALIDHIVVQLANFNGKSDP
jgi:D-alanyl-D-alanine carboxypeptidase/D-alanyl-D-alanine-endopeptidase (penicillin-binding protein 4)